MIGSLKNWFHIYLLWKSIHYTQSHLSHTWRFQTLIIFSIFFFYFTYIQFLPFVYLLSLSLFHFYLISFLYIPLSVCHPFATYLSLSVPLHCLSFSFILLLSSLISLSLPFLPSSNSYSMILICVCVSLLTLFYFSLCLSHLSISCFLVLYYFHSFNLTISYTSIHLPPPVIPPLFPYPHTLKHLH